MKNKLLSAQTVTWESKEVTPSQLLPVYQDLNRNRQEQAWRLASHRQLLDRQAINDLWVRLIKNRLRQAANAGLPDYRAYRWKQMLRFDYTPEDCLSFQHWIYPNPSVAVDPDQIEDQIEKLRG